MPVQFPTLSDAERQERVTQIAKRTLYPYSFAFIANGSGMTTQVPGNTSLYYESMAFQAPHNLAISDLEFQATFWTGGSVAGPLIGTIAFEVSYSPIMDQFILSDSGGPFVTPTTPTDTGNIIYRNVVQAVVPLTIVPPPFVLIPTFIDDFRRYEPYNYIAKYNQIIYMHLASDMVNAGLNVQFQINGTFIFHTLETGVIT